MGVFCSASNALDADFYENSRRTNYSSSNNSIIISDTDSINLSGYDSDISIMDETIYNSSDNIQYLSFPTFPSRVLRHSNSFSRLSTPSVDSISCSSDKSSHLMKYEQHFSSRKNALRKILNYFLRTSFSSDSTQMSKNLCNFIQNDGLSVMLQYMDPLNSDERQFMNNYTTIEYRNYENKLGKFEKTVLKLYNTGNAYIETQQYHSFFQLTHQIEQWDQDPFKSQEKTAFWCINTNNQVAVFGWMVKKSDNDDDFQEYQFKRNYSKSTLKFMSSQKY